MSTIYEAALPAAGKRSTVVFDKRTLLPFASAAATLLVHLLVPDNPGYTQKPLPYFSAAIFVIIAVTLGFLILSLFKQPIREKYTYKSWFFAAAIMFSTCTTSQHSSCC